MWLSGEENSFYEHSSRCEVWVEIAPDHNSAIEIKKKGLKMLGALGAKNTALFLRK
jgi:hypothetical protein